MILNGKKNGVMPLNMKKITSIHMEKISRRGIKGSHEAWTGWRFEAFFDSVRNHRPCPIDVYDAAAWMSVTALAEESIALGGHPVAIPDFTNGKWILAGENREYA